MTVTTKYFYGTILIEDGNIVTLDCSEQDFYFDTIEELNDWYLEDGKKYLVKVEIKHYPVTNYSPEEIDTNVIYCNITNK